MDTGKVQVNNHFSADRLLHAYLVVGPEGSDRSDFVNRLAAALVCDGKDEVPCGHCPQCRKAEKGIHPDILHIRRPENRTVFPVSTIRDLCADTFVVPNDARRKVYILHEAELMNASAQNAFLKTLEEPPAHCSFIIPIADPSLLLVTVRSRCGELRVSGAEEQISDAAREAVRSFLSAWGHSSLEAVSFLQSMDSGKDSKDAFWDFMDALSAEAIHAAAAGKLSFSAWQVLNRALDTAEIYRRHNVPPGYCIGMLSACVAGQPAN